MKEKPERIFKLKSGRLLKMYYDEDSPSPRNDDNLGIMACFHRHYCLGDKNLDYKTENYGSWEELEDAIIKNEKPIVILPVYLYDHSGITINTTGFSCPWDSGQVGFIYTTRKVVLHWYGVKKITPAIRKKAEEMLLGEVRTFDQYLRNDIFRYELVEVKNCAECEETYEKVVDSCCGFYGADPKENGMLDSINDEIVEEI